MITFVAEKFKSPEYAVAYLDVAWGEYEMDLDLEALLLILRDMTKVKAGIPDWPRIPD